MKKRNIILLGLSIVLFIIIYISINPIFIKHPEKMKDEIKLDEKEISISNSLAILSNITKKPHPTMDNEEEFNYIKNYLDTIGANYTVLEQKLDYEHYREFMLQEINNDSWKDKVLKEAGIKESDLKDLGYANYAEYLWDVGMKYSVAEETLEEWIKNGFEKAKIEELVLKNILVEIGTHSEAKDNIMFSVHYDSGLTLDEEEKAESFGAGDDGIAVAAILENIRVHKNDDFKNNVYILINEGEEDALYGATAFMTSRVLDSVKLFINIDNASNKGPLVMYRATDSKEILYKKYAKAVGINYSFSFWEKIKMMFLVISYGSDFDVYQYYGDAIDLALFSKHKEYHTKDDTYENISVDSLEETMKTVEKLMIYFGNDEDKYDSKSEAISFPILFTSLIINKIVYYAIVGIIFIVSVLLFGMKAVKKKYKIYDLVIFGVLFVLAIWCLINIGELALIPILPMLSISLRHWINKKLRNVVNIILYFIDFITLAEFIAVMMGLILSALSYLLLISLVIPFVILLYVNKDML